MKDEIFFREGSIDLSRAKDSTRELELSFSSEEPVDRYFGTEVLSHDASAVDLSRLNKKSAPLLWNHDSDDFLGTVRKAWLDDGKARALVRFGNSARSLEVWKDIKEGIISTVSVGYKINEAERQGDTMVATSWTPYEISIVPIPADITVGIGRSASSEMKTNELITRDDRREPMRQEYERRTEIAAIGQVLVKSRPEVQEWAARAILEGTSVEDFKRYVLTTGFAAKPVNTSPDVGMSAIDCRKWSLRRAINRVAEHLPLDGLEKDASDSVAKLVGRAPSGFYIPNEIVHGHPETRSAVEELAIALLKRDLSATGGGPVGGYTVQTDVLGGSLIELLRNMTICFELGARKLGGLQGNVAVPSQSGGATAFWVAENAKTNSSNLTFGQVGMTPHRLSGVTVLGKQLLAQTSVDAEGVVREDLSRVLAIAIDLAGLAGSGAGSQPLGIINTPGIGSVTFGGAATYAKVIDFETQVANANALLGRCAYASTPNTRAKLKQLRKLAGSTDSVTAWGDDGRMNGYSAVATKAIAGDKVIFGNWSDLVIADWIGMDVVVDPYTLADQHQVKITINMLVDIAIRHLGSFCASTDSGAQ